MPDTADIASLVADESEQQAIDEGVGYFCSEAAQELGRLAMEGRVG